MRSWTQDWNQEEGGEMENLEKGNYKKTPCSKAAPGFVTRGGLHFLGRRTAGWLLAVFVLESNKHI